MKKQFKFIWIYSPTNEIWHFNKILNRWVKKECDLIEKNEKIRVKCRSLKAFIRHVKNHAYYLPEGTELILHRNMSDTVQYYHHSEGENANLISLAKCKNKSFYNRALRNIAKRCIERRCNEAH